VVDLAPPNVEQDIAAKLGHAEDVRAELLRRLEHVRRARRVEVTDGSQRAENGSVRHRRQDPLRNRARGAAETHPSDVVARPIVDGYERTSVVFRRLAEDASTVVARFVRRSEKTVPEVRNTRFAPGHDVQCLRQATARVRLRAMTVDADVVEHRSRR
jgi:hypothetical protein